jgi:Mg2+-importing ATPase
MLIAVIAAALHFSEWRGFVRIAQEAHPWWLILAIAFQAATYFAHGQIWRNVISSAGFNVPLSVVYRFSLAKLFIDQALPSGGLSGTVVMARALEHRAIPRPVVTASVVVTTASYYAAYVLCLAAALVALMVLGRMHRLVVAAVVVFIPIGTLLAVSVLALAGRQRRRIPEKLSRFRPLRQALDFIRAADPKLARNRRLLTSAIGLQVAVVLLDSATVWLLIQALGVSASAPAVFASFMISSLFRSVIAFVPGGLGAFEASSVVTLKMAGVTLPIALSATLLFRGLSLWLPMIPGLWFSRHALVRNHREAHRSQLENYWALDADEVMRRVKSLREGLSAREAAVRLREYGRNEIREHREMTRLRVLLGQLRSPLLLLLVFAATAAAATNQWLDATIVIAIVLATVIIGYSREYSAHAAAAALRARIRSRANVLRNGQIESVPVEEVVPGDLVQLSAGSLIPADGILVEANDFFVSEAVLTGESYPVEKKPGISALAAALRERTNCVFLGTNVRSGTARFVAVNTATFTQFGSIAHRLALRPPLTEFDRGVRRFGYLLTTAMLVIVFFVFVAHMFREQPLIDTLLFSIALAVGLSPELLPAILSVNLARGATMMARHGVLVRRLNAIENLGSMDVLCTDKTGTLTEGEVQFDGAYDPSGSPSQAVLEFAAQNAALESGLSNPLDDAILKAHAPALSNARKLAEIPFDFIRKRVSVVVAAGGNATLITKGAFHHVLEICDRLVDGSVLDSAGKRELEAQFHQWSDRGVRVLAVATKSMPARSAYDRSDETELQFAGFVTFLDQPKETAARAVADLAKLGVSVKIITGDNRLVAQHVAQLVGLQPHRVLTGAQLDRFHDEALWHAAPRTDLFVEVDPNQKERIILSLKKMGHVVGFLGDGVNDAPAMHAADTSLSVEQAVDVAREAADFVLLERDLDVIRRGIEEGRRTFANTLKYVLTTTSANLGNMISMAGASLFLPFLPLTAGQILLNNFLSDVPALGLATDSVDPELVERPRRWDMRFIGRFMIEFGLLSSVFDLITFAALLHVFHATAEVFRAGWFVESLLTELVIALVVRTRRLFFRSRPGTMLLASTIALIVLAFAIPFLPFAQFLGFVPIPLPLLATLSGITALYVIAAELAKSWLYRRA